MRYLGLSFVIRKLGINSRNKYIINLSEKINIPPTEEAVIQLQTTKNISSISFTVVYRLVRYNKQGQRIWQYAKEGYPKQTQT